VLLAGVIFLLFSGVAITPDFGSFIIGLMTSPVLLLVLLACVGWSVAHRRGGRIFPLALILVAVGWPLCFAYKLCGLDGRHALERAHRQEVAADAGRDAVLTGSGD
jgi:hypothetical protein